MAALMQRVLIVDPQPAAVKLISDLLREVGPCQIWAAADTARALVICERIDPHLVIVEQCKAVDGATFTRTLRRSDLTCRKAPVIIVTSEATATAIITARDSGVHEFLRKPFTIKDLMRRLEAVTLRQRDWVEAVVYVGPDRRRFNSGDYAGPLKRRLDHLETPDSARICQALKILKSAVGAVESDPRQALRAMQAQCVELITAATATGNPALKACAAEMQVKLEDVTPKTLRAGDVEPLVNQLLAFMPGEDEAQKSQAA
ncbi:MAG: response regulator [Caulobacterales bacterium]